MEFSPKHTQIKFVYGEMAYLSITYFEDDWLSISFTDSRIESLSAKMFDGREVFL